MLPTHKNIKPITRAEIKALVKSQPAILICANKETLKKLRLVPFADSSSFESREALNPLIKQWQQFRANAAALDQNFVLVLSKEVIHDYTMFIIEAQFDTVCYISTSEFLNEDEFLINISKQRLLF